MVAILLPNRNGCNRGAVFERYGEFSFKGRVYLERQAGVDDKGAGVIQACRLELRWGQVFGLALPKRSFAVEIDGLSCGVVPHHKALGAAALYQVGLGKELRAQVQRIESHAGFIGTVLPGEFRRSLVCDIEERRVGPLFHEQLVIGFLFVHQQIDHAQGEEVVGAGAQVQLQVGLFAQVLSTRPNTDGALGEIICVNCYAAGVVVVGNFLVGSPLEKYFGMVGEVNPMNTHVGGDGSGELAGTFADLPGSVADVGGLQALR